MEEVYRHSSSTNKSYRRLSACNEIMGAKPSRTEKSTPQMRAVIEEAVDDVEHTDTPNEGGEVKPQVSNVLVTPKYSSHHMKIINDCLQQLNVFSGKQGESANRRLFQNVLKLVVPQVYNPGDGILKKGEECSGIYFIIEGCATVVTEEGDNVIATMVPGQYFGEVSNLFRLPVTARVQAQSRCQCLVLEEDHAWRLLPDSGKSVDIIDWFVARKYIPTSTVLDCPRIYRRLLLYSFIELPLFHGWPEESLKELVLDSSTGSVVLYPANSYIMCEGDPSYVMHVLLRGSAIIRGKSGVTLETGGAKFPIVLGESGLFTGTSSILSVKTVTECQVISLREGTILDIIKDSAVCTGAWERRKEIWTKFSDQQDNLQDVSRDIIQYEVIFQHLSNSSLFCNSNLPLVDFLVREATIVKVSDRELAYVTQDAKDRSVLLLLAGHLELVDTAVVTASILDDIQAVSRGQIIAQIPGMPSKATYRSVGDSYVIKYKTAFLTDALIKFTPNKKFVKRRS